MNINNIDLTCEKIKIYLSKNNKKSTDNISKTLNLNALQLENLLRIWEKNWNTFYNYGRIFFYNNKWCWVSKEHNLSREQSINNLLKVLN